MNFFKVTINNSVSKNGAGIYLTEQSANISNSSFNLNKASGAGGAIYLDCSILKNCIWNVSYNNFHKNSAQKGGAFHSLEKILLNKSSNNYSNNTAVYGNDYSSFPVRLTLEEEINNKTIISECKNFSIDCNLTNVASGQNMPYFKIAIIDTYGQKMILHEGLGFLDLVKNGTNATNGTNGTSSTNTSNNSTTNNQTAKQKETTNQNNQTNGNKTNGTNSTNGTENNTLIKGVKTVLANKGIFNFSEAIIISEPDTFLEIKVNKFFSYISFILFNNFTLHFLLKILYSIKIIILFFCTLKVILNYLINMLLKIILGKI